MAWLWLALAISFEILGTLSLKRASERGAPRAWYAAVVTGYGISYAFLALALADIPLGVAYGIWSGVGVVAMAILGRILFREPLTWVMSLGIVLIVGGVLLIETGAH
ncbi:Spermidine export protein MdtJ [Pseudoclavibacter triregionum]|nr:Spermidine export protein MdtJ [Pseudoclavibacter triregionum]